LRLRGPMTAHTRLLPSSQGPILLQRKEMGRGPRTQPLGSGYKASESRIVRGDTQGHPKVKRLTLRRIVLAPLPAGPSRYQQNALMLGKLPSRRWHRYAGGSGCQVGLVRSRIRWVSKLDARGPASARWSWTPPPGQDGSASPIKMVNLLSIRQCMGAHQDREENAVRSERPSAKAAEARRRRRGKHT
jgi:hypothetical protein